MEAIKVMPENRVSKVIREASRFQKTPLEIRFKRIITEYRLMRVTSC